MIVNTFKKKEMKPISLELSVDDIVNEFNTPGRVVVCPREFYIILNGLFPKDIDQSTTYIMVISPGYGKPYVILFKDGLMFYNDMIFENYLRIDDKESNDLMGVFGYIINDKKFKKLMKAEVKS